MKPEADIIDHDAPAPAKSGTRMAVIFIRKGESDEQAVDRHDREHPEDRGLSCVLVRYVDSKDGRQAEPTPTRGES